MIPIDEIKSQFGAEMAFIVLACRVNFKTSTVEELRSFLTSTTIDFKHIYEIVSNHGIRPVIHRVIQPVSNAVDALFERQLRQESADIFLCNSFLLKKQIETISNMKKNHLTAFPYKGPVLSLQLYNDVGLRESKDIDLLILEREYRAATQLLIDSGYSTDLFFDESPESYFFKNECQRIFSRNGDQIDPIFLEIQWKLIDTRLAVKFPTEKLFADPREVDIAGKRVLMLNDSSTFLSLLIHNGLNDSWRDLKGVIDLAASINSLNIDINSVLNEVSNFSLKNVLFCGILTTEKMFGIGWDVEKPRIADKLSDYVVANLLSWPPLRPSNLTSRHLAQHMKLRDSLLSKTHFLANTAKFLLRPQRKDYEMYRPPTSLFFLLPFLKIFRVTRILLKGRRLNVSTR